MRKNVSKKNLNFCSTYILLIFTMIVTNGKKKERKKETRMITHEGKKITLYVLLNVYIFQKVVPTSIIT
jgi:hypothetical protein